MADTTGMQKLETDAYRSRFDDGLLDLYIGISLLWIGASWMWFHDFAAISGIFPAIAVTPFVAWRTRFIESRSGYVKFSEERRRWERRNLLKMFVGGVLLLVFGIGSFLAFEQGGSARDIVDWLAPGIISLLIAVVVGLIAFASMLPRLLVYTAVLVVGGIIAAALETNPGAPLLVAGVVVTVWGAVLTTRFVRSHPKAEAA